MPILEVQRALRCVFLLTWFNLVNEGFACGKIRTISLGYSQFEK